MNLLKKIYIKIMSRFFSDLKQNDYVWVVYDENYESYSYSKNQDDYIQKYIVKPIKILENYAKDRKIDNSDFYDYEDKYIIYHEHYIKLIINELQYSRYYDDFYDKRGQMLMTPDFYNPGPDIEVFLNEKDAKEYLNYLYNRDIEILKKSIEKKQIKLSILETSFNKINYEEI